MLTQLWSGQEDKAQAIKWGRRGVSFKKDEIVDATMRSALKRIAQQEILRQEAEVDVCFFILQRALFNVFAEVVVDSEMMGFKVI